MLIWLLACAGDPGGAAPGCADVAWYPDADGDGWGARVAPAAACRAPDGHVARTGDCDDTDARVAPDAAERCDGRDEDCDGAVDDVDAAVGYVDLDRDGFGAGDPVAVCPGPGIAEAGGDCDDRSDARHPAAEETCDGVDEDCDGVADDGLVVVRWRDADGDGYGDPDAPATCPSGPGYADVAGDCADADPARHPAAVEVCGWVDDDCDGQVDEDPADGAPFWPDLDRDGQGDASAAPRTACLAGEAESATADDCLDTDPSVYTGAFDPCSDPADSDCDPAACTERLEGTFPVDLHAIRLDGDRPDDLLLVGGRAGRVGDADADGIADLLIRAPELGSLTAPRGGVWIAPGPLSSGGLLDPTRLHVGAPEQQAGIVDPGWAEVDGDGASEVLVPLREASGADGGVLVLGDPLAAGDLAALTTATLVFPGSDFLPMVADDLQGDGLDELVASDQFAAPAGCGGLCGVVWFVPVPTSGTTDGPSAATTTLIGGSSAYTRVAGSAGDVDGDGVREVWLDAGADLVLARDDGTVSRVADLPEVITGASALDALAADVDGDGLDDLVYGSPYDGADAGIARVLLAPFAGARDATAAEATLEGAAGDAVGGSPVWIWGGLALAGSGRYHHVPADALSGVSLLADAATLVLEPSASGDADLGSSAAAPGDVDGDGVEDLALSETRAGVGGVWIVHGI